jgi:hypothetical protein
LVYGPEDGLKERRVPLLAGETGSVGRNRERRNAPVKTRT